MADARIEQIFDLMNEIAQDRKIQVFFAVDDPEDKKGMLCKAGGTTAFLMKVALSLKDQVVKEVEDSMNEFKIKKQTDD